MPVVCDVIDEFVVGADACVYTLVFPMYMFSCSDNTFFGSLCVHLSLSTQGELEFVDRRRHKQNLRGGDDGLLEAPINPHIQQQFSNTTTSLTGERRLTSRMKLSSPSSDGSCTVVATTTMYIAADSDFVADAVAECDICAGHSASQKAAAAVQEIFVAVRELYLRELCIDLQLTGYDIRTNSDNDPYRDLRLKNGPNTNPCGNPGLMRELTTW